MALEDWQALGIVCGALIAFLSLVGLTWRWGVRPVWHTLKRINQMADLLIGDRANGIPSLQDRLADMERRNAERVEALTRALEATTRSHEEHMHRWHTRSVPSGGARRRMMT